MAVFIIVRHGHRAPIYSLPGYQPPDLNCTVLSSVDGSQAADFVGAMDALPQRRTSVDPAWRRYGLYPASTSCSGAQLTAAGALQMVRVGQLLRAGGYSEVAGSGVVVRTSDYSRTVQSAAALLYGLGGQTADLIDSAKVELTQNAYLCLDQRRASSTWWNVTCSCRSARTVLTLHRRRHNRTSDSDERRLRTEIGSVLNVTSSQLPWTSAILEVLPTFLPPSMYCPHRIA